MTVLPKPSRERLTELFLMLTRLPSPSRSERRVADAVIASLKAMGIEVHEDGTGSVTGGDTGNLWCLVRGDGSGPHLALGAHLDTVVPTDSIEPVLDGDGVFRNSCGTILGGDDKVAIAALLHATELFRASATPFPSYELLFTVSEETGVLGARHLDQQVLTSPVAAVLDASGPVGGIIVKAPSHDGVRATFRGRAAHAGVEPERGRSAIQAAARAIAAMRLGRLDEETSANIGVIQGGVASNIIPEVCEVIGECRSQNESTLAGVAAAMVDAIQEAAAQTGVDVDVNLVHEYRAFSLSARSPAVRLSQAAMTAAGLAPRLLTSGGGSDANVLNARGLPTVNLGTGMTLVHSPDECVALDELERLCAVVQQLIALAPEFTGRGRSVASNR